MEGKIVYFEKTGPENMEAALGIAKQRAEEIGIKKILVASTTLAQGRSFCGSTKF